MCQLFLNHYLSQLLKEINIKNTFHSPKKDHLMDNFFKHSNGCDGRRVFDKLETENGNI